MAGKVTITHVRKRRTGMWHSQGQASGFTSPSIKDDAADDAGDDDSADDDTALAPDERRQLRNEAKRRRLQVKELRQENDALKAKLAGTDNGGSSGPDPSEVILGLVEAGLSRTRIRMAMKLMDLDSVADVDDAIEDLRDEYPELFASEQKHGDGSDLPGQGSNHNGNKNRGGPLNRADLERKYSALRPGRLW